MADGQMTHSSYDEIDLLPSRVAPLEAAVAALDDTYETKADAFKLKNALDYSVSGRCKNLLNVYDSQSAAGASSVTINGCTWTINADGTVTADSGGVTLTNSSSFFIFGSGAAFKTGETTVLSGCPSGGADNTFNISVRIGDDFYRDTGSGVEVPAAQFIRQCGITIYSGQVASHIFSPMLCPKRIYDAFPKFTGYFPPLCEMYYAMLQSGTRSLQRSAAPEEQEER